MPDDADLLIADLQEQADDLITEAEAELGRDLTDEERDSLLDEFLAGLDNEEEEPPQDESLDAVAQVANEFKLTPEEARELLHDD